MIRSADKIFGEMNDPNTVIATGQLEEGKLIVGAGNKGIKTVDLGAQKLLYVNENNKISGLSYNVRNKIIGTDYNGNLIFRDAPSGIHNIPVYTGMFDDEGDSALGYYHEYRSINDGFGYIKVSTLGDIRGEDYLRVSDDGNASIDITAVLATEEAAQVGTVYVAYKDKNGDSFVKNVYRASNISENDDLVATIDRGNQGLHVVLPLENGCTYEYVSLGLYFNDKSYKTINTFIAINAYVEY